MSDPEGDDTPPCRSFSEEELDYDDLAERMYEKYLEGES